MRYDELSSMVLAETRIGSCAWEPWKQIAEGERAGYTDEMNEEGLWKALFFTKSLPVFFGKRHRGEETMEADSHRAWRASTWVHVHS